MLGSNKGKREMGDPGRRGDKVNTRLNALTMRRVHHTQTDNDDDDKLLHGLMK